MDKKSKDYILERVEEGIRFINREAKKYGIKGLTFENALASDGKTIIYDEVVPAADCYDNEEFPRDLLEQVLEMPVEDYIKDIKESYSIDNVVFMLHVNKSGCSYCQADSVGLENLEYCTLYRITEVDWDEDGELDLEYASTYAHELLHAYGAWDLYNIDETSNLDEEQIELINTDFVNEIMMSQEQDINPHFIGDITAYQIGWIDEVDEKYEGLLN